MRKVKKALLSLLILIVVFTLYVFYINRNTVNMSPRQKVLQAVYPALMWFTKLVGKPSDKFDHSTTAPPVSFHNLQVMAADNSIFSFNTLKGKKVLLVNTASDCGYTGQYAELEKLYGQYKSQLEIIAFPSNDFKEQEKGNDADIALFCKKNYGVSFPIMPKSVVIKSETQNPVYNWLTNAQSNGWNSKAPTWNFSKYLVDEKGKLVNYFGPSVSPASKELIEAVEKR